MKNKQKLRLRYATNIEIYFNKGRYRKGYYRYYYDGWNNYLVLPFIVISWLTPPLLEDENSKIDYEDDPLERMIIKKDDSLY
jgi:hypothetical protein